MFSQANQIDLYQELLAFCHSSGISLVYNEELVKTMLRGRASLSDKVIELSPALKKTPVEHLSVLAHEIFHQKLYLEKKSWTQSDNYKKFIESYKKIKNEISLQNQVFYADSFDHAFKELAHKVLNEEIKEELLCDEKAFKLLLEKNVTESKNEPSFKRSKSFIDQYSVTRKMLSLIYYHPTSAFSELKVKKSIYWG